LKGRPFGNGPAVSLFSKAKVAMAVMRTVFKI